MLTNLMLLRAGYAYASYGSLETVIEHNSRAERDSLPEAARRAGAGAPGNDAYYLALRRTQTSFGKTSDWEPWVLFFLRALKSQIGRLRERLETPEVSPPGPPIPDDLSPLAGRLLDLLNSRGTLSVREAVEQLDANRNTLKDKFTELVETGHAERRGKGRGAYYRALPKWHGAM